MGRLDVDQWMEKPNVCISPMTDVGKPARKYQKTTHKQNPSSSRSTDTCSSAKGGGGVGRGSGDQGAGGRGGRFPCAILVVLLGRWQRYVKEGGGEGGSREGVGVEEPGTARLHFWDIHAIMGHSNVFPPAIFQRPLCHTESTLPPSLLPSVRPCRHDRRLERL